MFMPHRLGGLRTQSECDGSDLILEAADLFLLDKQPGFHPLPRLPGDLQAGFGTCEAVLHVSVPLDVPLPLGQERVEDVADLGRVFRLPRVQGQLRGEAEGCRPRRQLRGCFRVFSTSPPENMPFEGLLRHDKALTMLAFVSNSRLRIVDDDNNNPSFTSTVEI